MRNRTTALLQATPLLGCLLIFAAPVVTAASLEEQAKTLEQSVQSVETRRKAALHDLNVNVLQAFRDAIKLGTVETSVDEVFDQTVRVKVEVPFTVDWEEAKKVRATISKYFPTVTDKEEGVEPYGRIYTRNKECVEPYCAVRQELDEFMRHSAVGIHVRFLGEWQAGVLMEGNGIYEIKPGRMTFLVDVPKSKLKGDPKPVVEGQIYDVTYCDGGRKCVGVTFSPR